MPTVVLVICQTRYRTNGWTKQRLYASPFGEHNEKVQPLRTTTMGDNPRKLKTVGVEFTGICNICISKYLKRGITLLGNKEKNLALMHIYLPWVTTLEGFKIIH